MKTDPGFDPATLSVTHIFDGEEVVTAGPDGQIHVATFSSRAIADFFIWAMQEVE